MIAIAGYAELATVDDHVDGMPAEAGQICVFE
jgi:hypothetical protein